VFDGDDFDYSLGDNPFIKHKPGDEDRSEAITHVYAVGRVRGSDYPVIEVWTVSKVRKHRDHYNKVGDKHYSFRDWEMYARKVPLLQVLKYMPASIELNNAITAANAAEMGKNTIIDGDIVTILDDDGSPDERSGNKTIPACTPESFAKNSVAWKKAVESGKKSVNDLIATIQTKELLTDDQKVEIASWAPKAAPQGE
jgi:recombination protein RecT